MAIDSVDSPSSPSPPPSHFFSQPRHFYLAVDRFQFKMETLVDLLGVAGRRSSLPIVLCCSSRDELDSICSAVSNLPYISLASLYSDLAEAERTLILEKFRQGAVDWNRNITSHPGDDSEAGNQEQKSSMIVVTDACLPLLSSGESSISARLLINYEIPTKKVYVPRVFQIFFLLTEKTSLSELHKSLTKRETHKNETYLRRMSTCLASDGIVINMVVGGEVVTLKSIEESSSLVIAEMPINISEIL